MNLATYRVISLGCLGLLAQLPAQEHWSQMQGNSEHSGYLPVSIEVSSLKQRWSKRIGTTNVWPPVTGEGCVFVAGLERTLWRLNSKDGSIDWQVSYPSSWEKIAPPSYHDGRVYMQIYSPPAGYGLKSYDALTGTVKFTSPFLAQSLRYYAPTIRDGFVYVPGGKYGGMHRFASKTGGQSWWKALPAQSNWTPAVDDHYVYSYINGTVTVTDKNTGVTKYEINDTGVGHTTGDIGLALGDKNDLFVVQSNRLAGFNLGTRSLAFSIQDKFSGSPAVDGDLLYVINNGTLDARSRMNGTLSWRLSEPGFYPKWNAPVIVTADHILISGNKTVIIDRKSQKVIWTHPSGGHLTIGDDTIYIGSDDGTVTAVGFDPIPNPTHTEPSRAHYTTSPTVKIKGTGLDALGTVEVWFGNQRATQVKLQGSDIICQVPPLGPGIFDLRVKNSIGSRTLARGFIYTPALTVDGDFKPGGSIFNNYSCSPGDRLLCLIGLPSTATTPIPPFDGLLSLMQPTALAFTPPWPWTTFGIKLSIPNVPTAVGATVTFQGLIGTNLTGGVGSFTNAETVSIR